MDENKNILLIAKLETKIKTLTQENQALKIENGVFARLRAEQCVSVVKLPQKAMHLTTRKRVDGSQHVQWGIVMTAVRQAKNLTAREIVKKTGFDRYAVYAAARRAKIKLKPAYPTTD